MKKQKGFTLIEILIVIGIIAILAAIVIIAINPGRQFAQARDTQRSSAVRSILNAVHQNMIDNRGVWTCAEALPGAAEIIASDDADPLTDEADICSCLVDTYIAIMPLDPSDGTGDSSCVAAYSSGYTIMQAGAGRITVAAPGAELAASISVTR